MQKETSLGSTMIGGKSSRRDREKNDFYPTPASATRAFIRVWNPTLPPEGNFYEPACGDGAMAKVVEEETGRTVIASDLYPQNYGYGTLSGGEAIPVDFLELEEGAGDFLITNPPFSLAEEFIRKAAELKYQHTAFLLKSTYFHAAKRTKLFNWWRPTAIYAMNWRLDFLNQGGPQMDFMWVTWRGLPGPERPPTRYYILSRNSEITEYPSERRDDMKIQAINAYTMEDAKTGMNYIEVNINLKAPGAQLTAANIGEINTLIGGVSNMLNQDIEDVADEPEVNGDETPSPDESEAQPSSSRSLNKDGTPRRRRSDAGKRKGAQASEPEAETETETGVEAEEEPKPRGRRRRAAESNEDENPLPDENVTPERARQTEQSPTNDDLAKGITAALTKMGNADVGQQKADAAIVAYVETFTLTKKAEDIPPPARQAFLDGLPEVTKKTIVATL